MIVAGIHYARTEVDAARRLLRELGQSERALRSVLEFVRREGRRRRPPPTPVPAHRRVEHKRRALDRLARRWAQLRREIDPSYTWPQAQARVNRAMGVSPPRRRRRTRARRRPELPPHSSSPSSPATTPSRRSACASPAASRASTSDSERTRADQHFRARRAEPAGLSLRRCASFRQVSRRPAVSSIPCRGRSRPASAAGTDRHRFQPLHAHGSARAVGAT